MAVLCEAISVVVRRDSIDKYFKGGWVKFQNDVPNSTMCTDGELVRVGFMSPNGVQEYVETLEKGGLQFQEKEKFLGIFRKGRRENDLVVVDQHQGPTLSCDWIEFGKFPYGEEEINVSMCWLFEGERIASGIHMKSTRMDLHHPLGWTIAQTRDLKFSGFENFRSQYKFLRYENGLSVFLDKESETEVFIGNPK